MELEIINKLFLELSQVATAKTFVEIRAEQAVVEHRDGRLAALEKLAKVTQCAEEMLRCFDEVGCSWGGQSKAACEAMKRAIDSPG